MTWKPRTCVLLGALGCTGWGVAQADPDPGLILSVGDQPKGVSFTLPAESPYYFEYPGAIVLWGTPTKDNLIASGQHLTGPSATGDVDEDGDIDLADFAGFQFCFTGGDAGPPGSGCEGLDTDGDDDVDLTDFEAFQVSLTGPFTPLRGDLNGDRRVGVDDYPSFHACLGGPGELPFACESADLDDDADVDLQDYGVFQTVFGDFQRPNVPLSVYAEGLTPSTALGDVFIELSTDPDGDGSFSVSDTRTVTVVEISVSPTTVRLGTPMVATLQPAGGIIAFDEATTATWTGEYVPTNGQPGIPLTITHDADEVLESSISEATMVAGAGSTDAPLAAFLDPGGTLVGKVTFDLNGLEISRPLDIHLAETIATIYSVAYDDDMIPSLGAPPGSIMIFPGPVPDEEAMIYSTFHHYVAGVPVERNAQTLTGPPTLDAQVLSLDTTLTTILDSFDITLSRLGETEEHAWDVSLAPPDGTGQFVCDTRTLPDSRTVTDVDVDVQVTHTYIGDLIITVEHNGETVTLWYGQCGDTDNMDVLFNDEGWGGDTPCSFIPLGSPLQPVELMSTNGTENGLADFDGMDKQGDWTICISDNAPVDTGMLTHWSLHITGDTPLPDSPEEYIWYVSDLTTPLFPLGVDVDRGQFTKAIPYKTEEGGFVMVVGEEVQP